MAQQRSRDETLATAFEAVATALRAGEADVYGYRVQTEPEPAETGLVAAPEYTLRFRLERESDAQSQE